MEHKIILPYHDAKTHKGQVGKIFVVGGSHKYYGAPILAALGAENSGADLITIYLPAQHGWTARYYSLNLFVEEFQSHHLTLSDTNKIIDIANAQDALVIGNGLGKEEETIKAVLEILNNVEIPIILDAEALIPQILDVNKKSEWIVTPHKREFERVFSFLPTEENIREQAAKHKLTILVKGEVDIIADYTDRFYSNKTGCPEMRVGGTGDVLAGIVGSFVGQQLSPFGACCSAARYWGLC